MTAESATPASPLSTDDAKILKSLGKRRSKVIADLDQVNLEIEVAVRKADRNGSGVRAIAEAVGMSVAALTKILNRLATE